MPAHTKTKKGLLIVLGGLPGTGKTSLSKELSAQLGAVYLRIDTIEQALLREDALKVGNEGYLAAYAIAEDNLKTGNIVIADSVNSIPITRDAWHDVARRSGANILEIEVICSDKAEHRRRVEKRTADIPGHKMPAWDEVINRAYHPWQTKDLTLDTSKQSIAEAVEKIISLLQIAPTL
jgi:predicted kinase